MPDTSPPDEQRPRWFLASFGAFIAATALAAGVTENLVHKGHQPNLHIAVAMFGLFLTAGFLTLGAAIRDRT